MTDYKGKLRLLDNQPVKLRHVAEDLERPIWPQVLAVVALMLVVTIGLVFVGARL